MRFNIISNLNNGAGLQRSYEILRKELECRGHQVHGIQFNKALDVPRAHINVFLETVRPEMFKAAHKQWVIPMPEWWDVRWFDLKFDRVLALTRDCHRLFAARYGSICHYLGWKALDLLEPSIPREPRFLHVAGKSPYKNTPAVVEGCRLGKVSLTVIARTRIGDDQLKRLMNSHQFHIMPSAYEGYGYVLHEALGVGAVLLTTDAPPMNEVSPAIYIPSRGTTPRHATVLHTVEAHDVKNAVQIAMQLSAEELSEHRKRARQQFEQDEHFFQEELDRVLKEEYA